MSTSGALAWSLLVAPGLLLWHTYGGFHRDTSVCLSNHKLFCHRSGTSHLPRRTDAVQRRPTEGKERWRGAGEDALRSCCVLQQLVAAREGGTPHRHRPSR